MAESQHPHQLLSPHPESSWGTIALITSLVGWAVKLQLDKARLLERLESLDPKSVSSVPPSHLASAGTAIAILLFIIMMLSALWFSYSEYLRIYKSHAVSGEPAVLPIRELIWYRVDFWLSASSLSKPIALLFATYVLIFVGALLMVLVSDDVHFSSAIWESWTFVADPGTHAEQEGVLARLVAFLLTIGGMLIFALMIGIIADGVSGYLDYLKQGKSRVVESQHTLILGWSDKVLPSVQELCVANESEGGGVVVVMAEREKEEMEAVIGSANLRLLGTVVVCRSGSPILMNDLRRVSAGTARAVIVMADRGQAPDESDARAVRVALSLCGLGMTGHAVVELCDVDNRQLVELVAPRRTETVVAHDMIGRSMLQCSRQPGLAKVLMAIMGFDGDEFYMECWPSLVGATFGEVLFRFPDAVPLGVKTAPQPQASAAAQVKRGKGESKGSGGGSGKREHSYSHPGPDVQHLDGGRVLLNPPDSYVIQPGDEILVLAEDDDSYQPVPASEAWVPTADVIQAPRSLSPPPLSPRALARGPSHVPIPEFVLFCGWRRDVDDMIVELDKAVQPGSILVLMSGVPIEDREELLREGGLEVRSLRSLRLLHVQGNTVSRRCLEQLPVPLCAFSSILILADQQEESDMQTTDSRSLACLLLIRDILEQSSYRPPPLPRHWAPMPPPQHRSPMMTAAAAVAAVDASFFSGVVSNAGSSPRRPAAHNQHHPHTQHPTAAAAGDYSADVRRRSILAHHGGGGGGGGSGDTGFGLRVEVAPRAPLPAPSDGSPRVVVLDSAHTSPTHSPAAAPAAAPPMAATGCRGLLSAAGEGEEGECGSEGRAFRRGSALLSRRRSGSASGDSSPRHPLPSNGGGGGYGGAHHSTHAPTLPNLSRVLQHSISADDFGSGSGVGGGGGGVSSPVPTDSPHYRRRVSMPLKLSEIGRVLSRTVVMQQRQRQHEAEARQAAAAARAAASDADDGAVPVGSDSDSGDSSSSTVSSSGGSGGSGEEEEAWASRRPPVVISEILDSRTRSLIAVAKISDYVMSNEIVSCAMAMVAERREVNAVLNELLAFDGDELHLRPARMYAAPGERLCFYAIMHRARRLDEIAIGYKVEGEDESVLNPRDKTAPRVWAEGDVVVVIAEE